MKTSKSQFKKQRSLSPQKPSGQLPNFLKEKTKGSALEPFLNSEHQVEIEKLSVGGDGIARIPFEDKKIVVFVPYSAPGDNLKIKITSVEKNHLYGQISEIVNPSPQRQTPPCEYFGECGGCNWQHINIDAQIAQKESILKDLLSKNFANLSFKLLPTIRSELNLSYRNRIQVKQLGTKLGYFKRSSNEIVNVESCLLAEPEVSNQLSVLRERLSKRPTQEIRKFEIRKNSQNKIEDYPIGEAGEGLSFSQVNNSVNAQLVDAVIKIVEKINPSTLNEFYAGAGNFTFPILKSRPACQMESVEMNPILTQHALAESLKLKFQRRLSVYTAACETFVKRRPISQDFVLLDPPRSGCHSEVLQKVSIRKPKDIVYISCHPAFLMRDLKALFTQEMIYEVNHLQIFDMFPQTDHFETLVWLSLKN